MNLLLKRILGASFAFAAFSFVTPAPAKAQSCAVAPTCESLGYTLTEADCEGHNFLKCPFDTSVGYCDFGSIGNSGICDNPAIGDILFSDKTCSKAPLPGKTPIGIVFDIEFRKAIALDSTELEWATEDFDISGLVSTTTEDVKSMWDGKKYTKTIIEYSQTNNKSFPAAEYAQNYSTKGTKQGDWHLPAGAELQAIYDNRTILNGRLYSVGGTEIPTGNYWNSSHWASISYIDRQAWLLDFSNGSWDNNYYWHQFNVRPILSF